MVVATTSTYGKYLCASVATSERHTRAPCVDHIHERKLGFRTKRGNADKPIAKGATATEPNAEAHTNTTADTAAAKATTKMTWHDE